jgi:hypothetical protein
MAKQARKITKRRLMVFDQWITQLEEKVCRSGVSESAAEFSFKHGALPRLRYELE